MSRLFCHLNWIFWLKCDHIYINPVFSIAIWAKIGEFYLYQAPQIFLENNLGSKKNQRSIQNSVVSGGLVLRFLCITHNIVHWNIGSTVKHCLSCFTYNAVTLQCHLDPKHSIISREQCTTWIQHFAVPTETDQISQANPPDFSQTCRANLLLMQLLCDPVHVTHV